LRSNSLRSLRALIEPEPEGIDDHYLPELTAGARAHGGELGAHVRKGEHGALVVFADRFTKTETDDRARPLKSKYRS
jgi:antirestriction factor ArdC-like protein